MLTPRKLPYHGQGGYTVSPEIRQDYITWRFELNLSPVRSKTYEPFKEFLQLINNKKNLNKQ